LSTSPPLPKVILCLTDSGSLSPFDPNVDGKRFGLFPSCPRVSAKCFVYCFAIFWTFGHSWGRRSVVSQEQFWLTFSPEPASLAVFEQGSFLLNLRYRPPAQTKDGHFAFFLGFFLFFPGRSLRPLALSLLNALFLGFRTVLLTSFFSIFARSVQIPGRVFSSLRFERFFSCRVFFQLISPSCGPCQFSLGKYSLLEKTVWYVRGFQKRIRELATRGGPGIVLSKGHFIHCDQVHPLFLSRRFVFSNARVSQKDPEFPLSSRPWDPFLLLCCADPNTAGDVSYIAPST